MLASGTQGARADAPLMNPTGQAACYVDGEAAGMSTARTRRERRSERKRAGTRSPGVWRGALPGAEAAREPVQHGARPAAGVSWRMVSALVTAALGIVLSLFFLTDLFYIRTITVAGADLLTESEVFRLADIAEVHVFWVDPEQVARNIEVSNVVADAEVRIGWPPQMVRIVIEERDPALAWVQEGVTYWVDIEGRVLRIPSDAAARPDLLRVVAENVSGGPPTGDERIDPAAVQGALQLRALQPALTELRYDPVNGLGFRAGGGWDAWFGTGTDMRNKLVIYEALAADLQARGRQPVEINVADTAAVYYR